MVQLGSINNLTKEILPEGITKIVKVSGIGGLISSGDKYLVFEYDKGHVLKRRYSSPEFSNNIIYVCT